MLIAFMPLIIRLCTLILDYIIKRKSLSEESSKIFILAREELRNLSQKNIMSAYESEDKIKEINRLWDERSEKK